MPELMINIIVEDDEDMTEVAKSLIGIKGNAELVSVRQEPGDQWPVATYRGSTQQLAAIRAKSEGSPIGRPSHEPKLGCCAEHFNKGGPS